MSQFASAFTYLMQFEDPKFTYAAAPDAGGMAISGINSKAWPWQYDEIAAMPQESRAAAVQNFYAINFWNPLQIGGIASQDVADRVMDMCVNGGKATGVMCLQRAVNACSGHLALETDGVIGSLTLEAVNTIEPETMMAAYRSERVKYYEAIVVNIPADDKYLAGWLKRAQA